MIFIIVLVWLLLGAFGEYLFNYQYLWKKYPSVATHSTYEWFFSALSGPISLIASLFYVLGSE